MRTADDIRGDHRLYNEDHRYCTFCEQEWPCDAAQMVTTYDRLEASFTRRVTESIGGESAARILTMFAWAKQEAPNAN